MYGKYKKSNKIKLRLRKEKVLVNYIFNYYIMFLIRFYVGMFVTTLLICLKIVKYMKLKVANELL